MCSGTELLLLSGGAGSLPGGSHAGRGRKHQIRHFHVCAGFSGLCGYSTGSFCMRMALPFWVDTGTAAQNSGKENQGAGGGKQLSEMGEIRRASSGGHSSAHGAYGPVRNFNTLFL